MRPTRYTDELVARYTRFWEPITFSHAWDENARKFPDREALVESTHRLTWAQAKQWIDRVALGFVAAGIQRDEIMAIQLPNFIELPLLRIACEKAGIIHMPLLRNLRHRDVEYLLNLTEAVAIVIPVEFGDFNYLKMVQEIRPRLPRLKHIFVVGDIAPPGTISISEMARQPLEKKYPKDFLESRRFAITDLSWIGRTSGTTGFPKAVEYTPAARISFGRGSVKLISLTADDATSIFAPGPTGPNVFAYFAAPLVGAKSVMLERFEAGAALELIQKERITVAVFVPPMLAMILELPNFGDYDLSSLRLVSAGGAPFEYELALRVEAKMKCPVLNTWASMDSGILIANPPDMPREKRLASVGKPVGAGGQVKLIDDSGNEVPCGQVGEILVASPSAACGYYKDPEATWAAWSRDGWFKTGDLGQLDKEGNLAIVGRKKDTIKRGGENVIPKEIEDYLRTHPAVADVAVVGMPDPIMGERACAYVVLRPGQQLTFDGMVSFLKKQQIALFKLPERLEIIDRLPLVAEQKVDKKLLRTDIAAKLKSEGKI